MGKFGDQWSNLVFDGNWQKTEIAEAKKPLISPLKKEIVAEPFNSDTICSGELSSVIFFQLFPNFSSMIGNIQRTFDKSRKNPNFAQLILSRTRPDSRLNRPIFFPELCVWLLFIKTVPAMIGGDQG